MNVEGLSLSANKNIGYFNYVPLKDFKWEFEYNIQIKDASEVKEIRLMKWDSHEHEQIFI